ncbi:MAG: LamG-like jellyroll fold domain-containing protein, partial [Ornithinimicrobium sp.]
MTLITAPLRAESRRRLIAVLLCALVLVSGTALSGRFAAPAHAAASPVAPRTPGVVTADSLPTVQIDGIAWSQAVVNNVVYAGGAFANARPAGAAAGVSQTPRGNLLAYNIATGTLISDFAPRLNGQVLAIAGSPDGSRVYVGGDFTEADGAPRSRIAAYSTTTGRLVNSFAPPVGYQVRSIVATDTTVYVGGAFAGVGSQTRGNLAAFDASTGALLAWAPQADRPVSALTLTADGTHVIAGGSFETINGTAARGLVKLDAKTGKRVSWPVAVANGGPDAGITSLSTDGNVVSGTAYHYGPGGNTEGPFRLDAITGGLLWLADCHGDTYGQFASAQALYVVGHSHDCGNVGGGFPEVRPQHFQRAMAFSKDATGTNLRETHSYYSWEGKPSPSIIQWLPELTAGKVSGQNQAAWAVTGNDRYVALAGEFPRVNGQGQQGLARFATTPTAPGERGPVFADHSLVPDLEPMGTGAVKIGWLAGYDQDDQDLTYQVVRSPGGVVASLKRASTWWQTPALSHIDTGLQPGMNYRYRVQAVDGSGNRVLGATRDITVPNRFSRSDFRTQVLGDAPSLYWPLDDSSGSFQDQAGSDVGIPVGDVATEVAGATPEGTAIRLGAETNPRVYARGTDLAPTEMSASVWVKTTVGSGRIFGFSDNPTGSSGHQDRQLYLSNDGRLNFGVFSQTAKIVTSDKTYNDNEWHQVVATLSGQTAELYVDGVRVGRRTDITAPDVFVGQWRLGWDRAYGWPNSQDPPFAGDLDEVAVFPRALSADQIRAQYDTARGGTGVSTDEVTRVAGTDRFGTAAKVATESGYPTGLDTVYIANGLNFPDA